MSYWVLFYLKTADIRIKIMKICYNISWGQYVCNMLLFISFV